MIVRDVLSNYAYRGQANEREKRRDKCRDNHHFGICPIGMGCDKCNQQDSSVLISKEKYNNAKGIATNLF